MGCCGSRGAQWKNAGFDSAYVYSSGCCCFYEAGFRLADKPEDPRWEQCEEIIEDSLEDADDIVDSTRAKGFCAVGGGYQESAVALNTKWVPAINQQIAQFGYSLDAYEWTEMVWMSNGQYGGGQYQPVSSLALRIKGPPDF
mmetsp:Transcript_42915/g.79706  ORF Transcript_42915/g.79706 Transcript_42915/m.79706 type:complete len:142 (+) Transcript_42915:57-482(+)